MAASQLVSVYRKYVNSLSIILIRVGFLLGYGLAFGQFIPQRKSSRLRCARMSVVALQNDVPILLVNRMVLELDTWPSTLFSHCRANLLTFASDGGAFGPGEARPLTPFAIHGLPFDPRCIVFQVCGRLCGVWYDVTWYCMIWCARIPVCIWSHMIWYNMY